MQRTKLKRLLIANRGEIAIRIAATAAEMGIETVVVYADDDAQSLHRYRGDRAVRIEGAGAAAYLDASQLVAVARKEGCDAVHPGYGFLSENADFARACREADIVFVGPDPEVLALFSDKAQARGLATANDVPVLRGSVGSVDLAQARDFFASLPSGTAMMIKAVAGGGGRGMRIVRSADEIDEAFAAASAEAERAFGNGELLVETFLAEARHIEIQVLADGKGGVTHLGERECSLQRRHQKLIEIAPCPGMPAGLRDRMTDAAMKLARAANYHNIGTFEFLVDREGLAKGDIQANFYFMEANPRIQVEHTITEEICGVDLVRCQLRIAGGETIDALNLPRIDYSRDRFAIQVRLNLESMRADGTSVPAAGQLDSYQTPGGPGIRVDGYGYVGQRANSRYDSLLAKLICSTTGSFEAAIARTARALREFRVAGAQTNRLFLLALLEHEAVRHARFDTRFVDRHIADIVARARAIKDSDEPNQTGSSQAGEETEANGQAPEPGCVFIPAPCTAVLVELLVEPGEEVAQGQTLAMIEAMKMIQRVTAPTSGRVTRIFDAVGAPVQEGKPLLEIAGGEAGAGVAAIDRQVENPQEIRADLAEVLERRAMGDDAARSDRVSRRHALGMRTARENIADLCDEGSFVEYGALAVAAQSRRRSADDLARNTPADGIVTGLATINRDLVGEDNAQSAVLVYDYMTLAGTQGHRTHFKMDRLLTLAERNRLPVVLYAEGGGGRPGDIDLQLVTGLDVASFQILARMSGLVPLVGVVAGRCFAGNAAMLGTCDVIIATRSSNIGMGGPALVEGGGLGSFSPEDIGPSAIQFSNGVIDILVEDEAEATRTARKYLSYFQGPLADWQEEDQLQLRVALPDNRSHAYDIRSVIGLIVDSDSVLELRAGYGQAMVTALARIEGRAVGIIANDPMHMGGAIDSLAADKASRFMQLLDAHGLPLVSLCDTPGFMVGPEHEKTAAVRRLPRMFVTAGGITIPIFAVVLRKAYGLGAMAMLGGQSHVPDMLVSWPQGEFGGMGLEGAIRLGLRKELEAIADPAEREAYFRSQLDAAYRHGRAVNAATHFEIDDVIDPAETRRWLARALAAQPAQPARSGKRRSHIDTW